MVVAVSGKGPMSAISDPDWQHNCVDLAAQGNDVWGLLGGRPEGWRECAALYRRLGVRTLSGAVSAVLGPPYTSPRFARRGDVVMVRGALGVCRGEVAECIDKVWPMRSVERAWPIRPLAGRTLVEIEARAGRR